jgi:hypothetical protein
VYLLDAPASSTLLLVSRRGLGAPPGAGPRNSRCISTGWDGGGTFGPGRPLGPLRRSETSGQVGLLGRLWDSGDAVGLVGRGTAAAGTAGEMGPGGLRGRRGLFGTAESGDG